MMRSRITALVLFSIGLLVIAWQILLVIAYYFGGIWEKYSRPLRE
jgi:hypothetical protein